jgi:stage V sporulation protein B
VASAAAEGKGVKRKLFFALGITALVSIPCAVGLYFFAEPAARLIFRSLQGEELTLLIGLIEAFAISAFLLSCVQTLSACLTAQGKPKFAALGMLAGVVAKTVTYAFLLRDSQISVYGLAYATNLCYLVAFLLDLLYNLIVSKNKRQRSEA